MSGIAMRKIVHIDMDAFFASVEQLDNPELRGKPVAVGGNRLKGVVAAASYEARKFGVRSAMPSVTAARLCPELIFVKPRFERYKEMSLKIRDIFYRYTDLVEPLSLDEAYLDITENKPGILSAREVAERIRADIFRETGLTASAGVSFNKFLAKMASDLNKPNGLAVITREKAIPFLEQLPIGKFFGIGKATASKMEKLGIRTGADLKTWSEIDLAYRFGKAGRWYYRIVRGEDDRRVEPGRVRKSVGAERTFSQDLTTPEQWNEEVAWLAEKVSSRLQAIPATGRTVTLKIKYNDFTQVTRSHTSGEYLHHTQALRQWGERLLQSPSWPEKPVRLLGLTVSGLDIDHLPGEGTQLELPL
jgi:DNA polymerase-4